MVKRLPAFLFIFLTAGILWAQDMPPLPPLPDQGQASNPNAATGAPPPAPAPTDNSQAQVMPPLPAAQTSSAAVPVPTSQSPNNNQANPALPPLPAAQAPLTAAATATVVSNNGQAPAPPSPSGEQPPLPAATISPQESFEQAAPVSTTNAESALTPEAVTSKKLKIVSKPWQASKYRPNVIFGGWVHAKGGNETSRLAWTSQEILNALIFKKYKLISPAEGKPEEGNYEGQEGSQWRQFNFSAPKAKLTVQVYIRQAGKKVWLRVGPSEAVAPAATSRIQAQKLRQADLAVLHLLQKKFGHRLSPHRIVANWESPYRYSKETADE